MAAPVRSLKGVGDKKSEQYQKLGVSTLGDFLYFFPRKYLDLSDVRPIAELFNGETAIIKAFVGEKSEPLRHRGLLICKAAAADTSGRISLIFYNQKFLFDSLKSKTEYFFYGRIKKSFLGTEMLAPVVIDTEKKVEFRPVYPHSRTLSSAAIERDMKTLLSFGLPDIEFLPEKILNKYNLIPLAEALLHIHFPESREQLESARRRLIFDEFFIFNFGISRMKKDIILKPVFSDFDLSEFFGRLSFSPTGAQMRAISEAVNDLRIGKPMNRLLQGDVGSGKTLVAMALCFLAWKNGLQAAVMAPTEILARQHFTDFAGIFAPFGVKVELLCAKTTAKQKNEIKRRAATGEIDLLIGTHSLLNDEIEFKKLGLIVTDEQHRFGVKQRQKLLHKAQNINCLVMSATPIPRTLGLVIYGDLDVSVLDEMPPGRQKVDTFLVGESYRRRLDAFIEKLTAESGRIYIVCPLIEDNEQLDILSVTEYVKAIKSRLPGLRFGLLHGRLKKDETESIVSGFMEGEIDVLVTTTVIEVGMNVPSAVLMIVENAERFGLSQLHQLRGRVGRSDKKSYCILVSNTKNEKTRDRLAVIKNSNDGFKIAEADLKLRGTGDLFGIRQHGMPEFRLADIFNDSELLLLSKEAVKDISDFSKIEEKARQLFSTVGMELLN